MYKVVNLQSNGEYGYMWELHCDNDDKRYGTNGLYYTDKFGGGLFYQNEHGEVKQLVGTCIDMVTETISGTHKKLNRKFNNPNLVL